MIRKQRRKPPKPSPIRARRSNSPSPRNIRQHPAAAGCCRLGRRLPGGNLHARADCPVFRVPELGTPSKKLRMPSKLLHRPGKKLGPPSRLPGVPSTRARSAEQKAPRAEQIAPSSEQKARPSEQIARCSEYQSPKRRAKSSAYRANCSVVRTKSLALRADCPAPRAQGPARGKMAWLFAKDSGRNTPICQVLFTSTRRVIEVCNPQGRIPLLKSLRLWRPASSDRDRISAGLSGRPEPARILGVTP